MTETIIKRDGRKAAFEPEKIRKSISRAFHDSGRTPGETDIAQLTDAVADAHPDPAARDAAVAGADAAVSGTDPAEPRSARSAERRRAG